MKFMESIANLKLCCLLLCGLHYSKANPRPSLLFLWINFYDISNIIGKHKVISSLTAKAKAKAKDILALQYCNNNQSTNS